MRKKKVRAAIGNEIWMSVLTLRDTYVFSPSHFLPFSLSPSFNISFSFLRPPFSFNQTHPLTDYIKYKMGQKDSTVLGSLSCRWSIQVRFLTLFMVPWAHEGWSLSTYLEISPQHHHIWSKNQIFLKYGIVFMLQCEKYIFIGWVLKGKTNLPIST